MAILKETMMNRKREHENRNGITQIHKNLQILKSLKGANRKQFAERMKGYLEALYDTMSRLTKMLKTGNESLKKMHRKITNV